jgi:hypothetical protein
MLLISSQVMTTLRQAVAMALGERTHHPASGILV